MLNRRLAMLGALAAPLGRPAIAQDKTSPVAHDLLAQNAIAQAFQPVTGELPDVDLWGPNGRRGIRELKGRTILMPLWAEWCAPCLTELPDFARLQQKYGNDKFAIVPVLTSTRRKFTPQLLAQILALAHASIFEPLIEDKLGATLAVTMGKISSQSYALPCNLLIAPSGHVVGREMGRIANAGDPAPPKTSAELIDRAVAGEAQTRWGQADGEEFAAAMANGFLV